jgi:hypothetical protein
VTGRAPSVLLLELRSQARRLDAERRRLTGLRAELPGLASGEPFAIYLERILTEEIVNLEGSAERLRLAARRETQRWLAARAAAGLPVPGRYSSLQP